MAANMSSMVTGEASGVTTAQMTMSLSLIHIFALRQALDLLHHDGALETGVLGDGAHRSLDGRCV